VAQYVKDLALSLLCLGSPLWDRFDPWLRALPHAVGAAPPLQKKWKREKKVV